MGKSSTHAVVAAQLISKGKGHGIHLFIVQLRDLTTLEPLPGTVYILFFGVQLFIAHVQLRDLTTLELLSDTVYVRFFDVELFIVQSRHIQFHTLKPLPDTVYMYVIFYVHLLNK